MLPFFRLWGWPLGMGLLMASGLVSALLSDHAGDAWSWVGLGVPVAVMAWCGLKRPARPERRPTRARDPR